jgi:hypothetical protein
MYMHVSGAASTFNHLQQIYKVMTAVELAAEGWKVSRSG